MKNAKIFAEDLNLHGEAILCYLKEIEHPDVKDKLLNLLQTLNIVTSAEGSKLLNAITYQEIVLDYRAAMWNTLGNRLRSQNMILESIVLYESN